MEAVEMLIYISLAMLVGGLILGFLSGWKYDVLYDNMRDALLGKTHGEFAKIEVNSTYIEVHAFYNKCVRTQGNLTNYIYILGEGNFSKAHLFEQFKSVGWCDSIQSNASDCGTREDIIMDDMILPKVAFLECIDNEKVRIS